MEQAKIGSEPALSGWEKRQIVKRGQIIDAAAQLFLEHGFGHVSMDAIVEAAGVSKRTLYNYYESKERLFLDVMLSHIESVWTALVPSDKPKGLETKLFDIGRELLVIAMKPVPIALYRIVIAESQRFPDLTWEFYAASSQRLLDALAELISAEGAAAGIATDDPIGAAEHFMDLLLGAAFMRVVLGIDRPMNRRAIEAHTQKAVDRFFAASRN